MQEALTNRNRHRLACLDVGGRNGGVLLDAPKNVAGDVIRIALQGVRLLEQPVDALFGYRIPRAALFGHEAVVDQVSNVLADRLRGDTDRLGDLALTDCGLAVGDLDEYTKPGGGSFVGQRVAHIPCCGRRV